MVGDKKDFETFTWNIDTECSTCSKRQQTVALSSCEAEYIALPATVQEALWRSGIKSHISSKKEPMQICYDNQHAIFIALNCGRHSKTKHNDHLEKDKFNLNYVSSSETT